MQLSVAILSIMTTGLVKTLRLLGGNAGVARAIGGISGEAVRKWGISGVPAERVISIYHATRGAVTPHDLRPDLFVDPGWLPPLESPADAEDAAA